jgi:hypothetical protein
MLRTNQTMALYVPQYNEERENYSYDGAGHLKSIYVTSGPGDIAVWNADLSLTYPTLTAAPTTGGQKTSTFGYDLMGRQTSQSDFDSSGTNAVYSRTAVYDLNGQLSSDSVSSTKNDSNIYKTDTTYSYADAAGLYQLGSVYSVSASNSKNAVYQNASSTVNAYQWWDGAVQGTITYKPDTSGSTSFTTSFIYDSFGQLYRVSINDGRPRTVNYRTNGDGQIIRRDESDNNTANGDPHEIWYRFNGMEVGYVGNNGTNGLTATGAVADRRVVAADGAFRNGNTYQTTYNDFAQSVDPLNSFSQGTSSGSYVVQRDGETLSSIARNAWGDASLWYEIAEANGLSGDVSLSEGQRLTLPSGVVANKHNAGTFKPYDPNEAIGNVSPTTPKPPKKNNCGVFGQILLAVIAIAITVIAPFGGSFIAQVGNAMLGSVVSQGVGVATGIQEKFSFGAVALAGISAVVGGGIGKVFGNGAVAGSQFVGDVVRGVAGSVVTQGIGVATGLQDKFSWAGVAAAGVGAGIGGAVMRGLTKDHGHFAKDGPETQTDGGKTIAYGKNAWVPDVGFKPSFGVQALAGTAQLFAGAATRSAIDGTSFGDAIVQGLPDVIGGVVGRALGGWADRELLHRARGKQANEPQSNAKTKNTPQVVPEAKELSQDEQVLFDRIVASKLIDPVRARFVIRQTSKRLDSSEVKTKDDPGSGSAAGWGGYGDASFVDGGPSRSFAELQNSLLNTAVALDSGQHPIIAKNAEAMDRLRGAYILDFDQLYKKYYPDQSVTSSLTGFQTPAQADFNRNVDLTTHLFGWIENGVPKSSFNESASFASLPLDQRWQIANTIVVREQNGLFGGFFGGSVAGAATAAGGTLIAAKFALTGFAALAFEGTTAALSTANAGAVDRYARGEATTSEAYANDAKFGLLTWGLFRGSAAGYAGVQARGVSGLSAAESGIVGAPGASVRIGRIQATEIGAKRITTTELAALQSQHGTEFAQVYLTGAGRNGGGGTYYLIQGTDRGVSIPVGPNVRLINHSHPEFLDGALVPLRSSAADQNVLRTLQRVGSPQRQSQIVPEVGTPFYFKGN